MKKRPVEQMGRAELIQEVKDLRILTRFLQSELEEVELTSMSIDELDLLLYMEEAGIQTGFKHGDRRD